MDAGILLPASFLISFPSSPALGGLARSPPIMEKRSCAHECKRDWLFVFMLWLLSWLWAIRGKDLLVLWQNQMYMGRMKEEVPIFCGELMLHYLHGLQTGRQQAKTVNNRSLGWPAIQKIIFHKRAWQVEVWNRGTEYSPNSFPHFALWKYITEVVQPPGYSCAIGPKQSW